MTNQNYEIIISTCGKFSDLWDANVLLLNRNCFHPLFQRSRQLQVLDI